MEEHELESIWNGRFTDDINDEWQQLAKQSTSYEQFTYLVKQVLRERNDDY